MKLLVRVVLCCVLATGAWAQRGGGSRGGGGHSGGGGGFSGGSHGFSGGGGFHGGGSGMAGGGSFHGGGGISHGGFVGSGFHGYGYGYGYGRYGYGRGFGIGFYGGYWPWYGYGYGYPYYWGDYYPYYSGYGYGYDPYAYNAYGAYYSTPTVTAVYPQYQQQQAAPAPAPQQTPRPVMHEYRDEYGQSRDVTYLIAFRDGVIRAAVAYWVDGDTLHYVTRDHQERTTPLDSIDRSFSERLNRDQRVPFHLP